MNIAVLGGDGFLGSAIVKYFSERAFKVTAINKQNYEEYVGKTFEVFINANGNSKKFWANENPGLDFEASVVSVEKSITKFNFKKYIYISSSDVYPDHGNKDLAIEDQEINLERLESYGMHKCQAEQIIKKLPCYFILRCSAMVGENLKKGVIKDIQDNKELFITLDSKLQFISTNEIAHVIYELVSKNIAGGVFNLGGRGSVQISEVLVIFGRSLESRSDANRQEYEMNVEKLNSIIPLMTSEEYIKKFINK